MPDNDCQFLTRWEIEGTCGEVADVLGDPPGLPRWWFHIDQPTRPKSSNGPGRAVQTDSEKVAQRGRVGRAPRDPALRIESFKVANQQQTGTSHLCQ